MEEKKFFFARSTILTIFSVALAIALWLFISYTIDPEMTKRFNNIKIDYGFEMGEGIPRLKSDSDLTVVGDYPKAIFVEVKGPRNELIMIDSEDIEISVNLRGVTRGKGTYRIETDIDSPNLTVIGQEMNSVEIEFDDYVERDFEIKVEELGSLDDDRIIEYTLDKDRVKVSGARQEVDKIKKVVAVVNVPSISDGESKDYTLELIPKDTEEGQPDVETEFSKVNIVSEINMEKTVDLVYSLSGTLKKGFVIVKETPSHSELSVYGPVPIVKELESIACKPIDLRGISVVGNRTVDLNLLLPSGISLKDDLKPTLTLEIDRYVSRSISISDGSLNSNNISFGDFGEVLDAKIKEGEDLSLELKGLSEVMEKQKDSDIKIFFDLADLSEGEHELEYQVTGVLEGIDVEKLTDKIVVEIVYKN